ncbi:thioredoxin-like protein [Sporocytophaga myxococcoides]|uniref:Thioredoxin-like protein n=1 Tax=Sporocytophaga myxococcoides TaxID=153721 RepID=A0A098LD85_9BACT|nr:thioredoxin family protein [Sporocytophaga myxococcoides]GAL84379.1 thioredoxin-like protein [Sporocytophaga myxococcoides]
MRISGFLIILIAVIAINNCIAQSSGEKDLTGKTDIKEVNSNFPWFSEGYNLYQPDTTIIKPLSDKGSKLSFIVFGGTWCGDTQRELPKFYKITDEANIKKEKITLYLLNHDKKSPEKLEKKYKIHSIPTFIILINGKEAGRIVESPQNTLEKDLLEILN